MKISCLKENLFNGLQTISKTVSSRTTLPVLKNILLQIDNGRLKISATDLELGIICWVGAKVEKEGSITVPAKLLMDYVATLPEKKITLEYKNNLLHLTCENFNASFTTIDPDEFPEIPTIQSDKKFTIKTKNFKEAINKVVFATSKDDSRPVLSGVFMESKDNIITLVAADGYRLVEKKISFKNEQEIPQFSIIIPFRSLLEVNRIISNADEDLVIQMATNQLLFSTPNVIIFSRLIEGKFPDYKKIIPELNTQTTEITINHNDFLQAIKVNHLFAQDGSDAVHLEFDKTKQKLTISASTNQLGQSDTQLECKIKGKTERISFNAHYLLEVLNVISTKDIHFFINGDANPGVILDPSDKNYIYVVMPVKQL